MGPGRGAGGSGNAVRVRRAADRFVTRSAGVETLHCFSFGQHYDPAHVGLGPLVVCDEHLLAPGAGFDPHPHRGVEVVTWVLEGALVHDGPGGPVEVAAGSGQRLDAGSGVVHAERAGAGATRFVQSWLVGDADLPPAYGRTPADVDLPEGALVPVLSGLGHRGAAALASPAALHVGRLRAEAEVRLPDAPLVHLLVTGGQVQLEGCGVLRAGDSAGLTAAGPRVLRGHAELLVWEMQITSGG